MNDGLKRILEDTTQLFNTIVDVVFPSVDNIGDNTEDDIDDHVPADANEYYDGLRTVIGKIPEYCGKTIDCGPGWYPLIVSCDEDLTAICPDYEILQIKEKLGFLNYHFEPPSDPELHKKMRSIVRFYEKISYMTDSKCNVSPASWMLNRRFYR